MKPDGRKLVKEKKLLSVGLSARSPLWDPNTDLNNDGRIDMKDVATVARNFGKTNP